MNTIKHLLIILLFGLLLAGCKNDTVGPVTVIKSDLTRSGKFISFTSNLDGDYDIYLAQVDENGNLVSTGLIYPDNPHNLTNSFNIASDKQSNWSPDGRVLVFSSTQDTAQEIYAFFFNADGGIDSSVIPNPKLLFSSGGDWDNNPSFSPDGNYLIWDRRYDNNSPSGVDTADSRDLYIGDVSGIGNGFTVSNVRAITNTSGEDEYNPKWSPRISVGRVAYEFATSATSTDHDIYVIDPLSPSTNNNFFNPGRSGYPAWAPACDRIIFEADQGNGGFYKIVSLGYPSNSGTLTDIVQSSVQNLRYPTWLPNGNVLAYIRVDVSGGNGNIYIVPSTGGVGFGNKLLPSNFDAANNLWPAW
jgi:Tol biopolymer transport system component